MTGHHRILIVEDDALQALDLEMALQDAGFIVVGKAETRASALSMVEDLALDCAILDYNLAQETSHDVAEYLRDKKVPFVFVTGRIESLTSSVLTHAEKVFQKPYAQTELIACLVRKLGKPSLS